MQDSMQEIETLKARISFLESVLAKVAHHPDNEGTDTPQWFVIDPKQNMRADLATAASQFVGPFFSRARAESYLKARRYDYGKNAQVWCASAYHCADFKELYRESLKLRVPQ